MEKEMATHSSTLAWRIPWTEELGLQSMGRKELGVTERLHFHFLEWMMLSFILTDLLSSLDLVAQDYDCEKKMEGSYEKFGMTKRSEKVKSTEQKSCGRKTWGISLYWMFIMLMRNLKSHIKVTSVEILPRTGWRNHEWTTSSLSEIRVGIFCAADTRLPQD